MLLNVICCYIFWPHKAIITQLLIDGNHYSAWAYKLIYLHAVIACCLI
jgi:hypothetical protein